MKTNNCISRYFFKAINSFFIMHKKYKLVDSNCSKYLNKYTEDKYVVYILLVNSINQDKIDQSSKYFIKLLAIDHLSMELREWIIINIFNYRVKTEKLIEKVETDFYAFFNRMKDNRLELLLLKYLFYFYRDQKYFEKILFKYNEFNCGKYMDIDIEAFYCDTCIEIGDYSKADEIYVRIQQYFPKNIKFEQYKCVILIGQKKYSEALTLCEEIEKNTDGEIDTSINKLAALYNLKMYKEAKSVCERVLMNDPGNEYFKNMKDQIENELES